MSIKFNNYAQEGNIFLMALAKELDCPENIGKAGRILRSVLHAFRNYLTFEENLQLLAQLPMFLKALYVDGWTSKKIKRTKHSRDIIFQVKKHDIKNAAYDFANDEQVEIAISVVFMVMRKYVSLGEIEDIKAVLPKEIKHLLNPVLMV